MPTTIRLEDDVKRELDRLQGDFLAERGERLSHSELLKRLLRFARLHETALLEEDAGERGPTRADLERWLENLPDVRIEGDARDVDEALYGSRS